jgi:superfamily II DNA or RNA helicase
MVKMVNVADVIAGTKIEARPYQRRIVTKAIDMFQGRYENGAGEVESNARSILIESPTGSGKTVMAFMAAKAFQVEIPELVVGWVAMRRNLLAQAERENVEKGINVKNLHMVSMFDGEPKELLKASEAGLPTLMVVDEAQHDAASSMAHLHNVIKPTFILGLSATPFRQDNVKLCFDKVIKDAGIHQLIQEGYLSQYDSYSIPDWSVETVVETYLREPKRWGKSIFYFCEFGAVLSVSGVVAGCWCDL